VSDKALAVVTGQAITHIGEMSVQAVVDRKRKIVEVMDSVMREGEHFGKIPGCGDKPTLFKAGAEVLAMTFGLAPSFKIDRIDLPGGHREYQVICTLTHIASGLAVSEGVGAGTTMESKHRWRGGARLCPDCGKATIIKGKAEYGGGWLCFAKKGGCGSKWKDGDKAIESQTADRIENPDPADVFNTVLKMAKKRAQVDCTLTACGASDLLAQDLEDLPPGSSSTSSAPPADDAEFTDKPAKSRAQLVDDLRAEITACTTEAALEAVGDRIASMDTQIRERVRITYADHRSLLRSAAKADKAVPAT
jgi:hypothetical protein